MFLLLLQIDPNSLGDLVPALVEAVKGGNWSLVVSVALMLVVFALTKIPFVRDWLPKAAKPWVVAISGVVLAVATTAATTGDWWAAAFNGLVMGTAATGLWELVGKRLFEKDEAVDEPPAEEPTV
jgi:hypothetical protein